MTNLLKGVILAGTALITGIMVYKNMKNAEQKTEDVDMQELTQEQQEIYELTVQNVREQMKPYIRRNKIRKMIQCVVTLVMANCMGVIAITYDMERLDKLKVGV